MKIHLKYRQLELFKCLMTAVTPLHIEALSEKFKRSERTIRYDLNTIRDEVHPFGIEIKNKSKKGYYIPAAQKPLCYQILSETIQTDGISLLDDTPQRRYATLLLYFICARHYVSVDAIAEKFYLSKSSVMRLLNGMMQEYFTAGFVLISHKADGYEIQGDELTLRKSGAHVLMELFEGSYTPEDWYLLLPSLLKDQITLADLIRISNAIKKVNARYNVWISNAAFINLLCYCIIRDIRMRKGIYVCDTQKMKPSSGQGDFEYAYQLLQDLSVPYFSFDEAEITWMMKILTENGIFVNRNSSFQTELASILDDMLDILMKNDRRFRYQFDMRTLYDDLYEHLQHYAIKEEYHLKDEDNAVLQEIQTKYSDFYLLAKDCAKAFETKVQHTISDSEISYIAIYLYKNLIPETYVKKKVLVVCATGKGLSNLLTTRIKNVFQNLTVVQQVSPYQLALHQIPKDIDFIISTIPLSNVSLPVVKISRILSSEDIQRIYEFMQYGKSIDAISFNQNVSASFNAKADPFDLYDIAIAPQGSDLTSSSIILSKLMLTLLEYTAKFPKEYEMNQDALLGLVIHMIMAVPRWFAQTPINMEDDSLIQDYYDIASRHHRVFTIMEKFFQLVEDALLITIPISERHAFFLYIIKHEEDSYEKHTD